MSKIAKAFAAVAALLTSSAAFALGLGEIDVKSRLNQPLSAVIPISSSSVAELSTAAVRLGSNEDFERAGIDRTDFLSALEFEIKGDQVFISSRLPAREPVISFLVEVRWSGGRLQREYTILLDPPGLSTAQSKTVEPAKPAVDEEPGMADPSTMRPTAQPAARTDRPARQAQQSASTASTGSQTYGPVAAGETLWSIAFKTRPARDIGMDQMQLAIYEANRAAFAGELTGLHRGSTLTIPSEEEIRAIDAADAKAKVRGGGSGPVRKSTPPKKIEPKIETVESPAAAPVPAPSPAPTPTPAPAPAAVAPPPTPAPTPTPAPAPAAVAPPPTPAPTPTPAPAPAPPSAVTAAPTAPAPTPAPATDVAKAPAPATDVAKAPAPALTAPAAPATPPAGKSMYDEEPAASVPATPPASTEAAPATPAAPAETAQPSAPPQPPPVAAAPVVEPAENAGTSLLDNPLLLPAVAGIILLGAAAAGFVFWKRRRSASVEPSATPASSAPKFDPAVAAASLATKSAAAPAVKSAREKLEEDTRVTEHPLSSTAALSNTAAMESTLASTHATEAAQTLAQTVAQEPPMAQTAGGTPRKIDFDVTASFAAETVQINLDANDPLAEADFHLAYGLYDEAALLLKQAAEKNPSRVELRAKLAEVYFAAGKADEFRKTAEGLKSQVAAAQWSKLAIMGQQLCPDVAAFKDAGGAIATDMDLSFDEAPAAAAPPPAPAARPARGEAEVLDFKLDDILKPEPAASATPAKPADTGDALEFDLGELKLDEPAAGISKPGDINLEELSLESFDAQAGADDRTVVKEVSATVAQTISVEPSLDMPTGGDEVATKLDLARAYMDMGDTDMAKSLLGEVTQQGNSQQKGEAQGLLSRLGT